ncbi:mechanosensitive ion channel family protein [Flavobacterium chuncheonense]|uniref:Mechanosensitive ion channel family protein n=1 Tax=Flavobacterium chuncheonense TaxID=2026653 RepID=A0ABW5YLW2_9FLAO
MNKLKVFLNDIWLSLQDNFPSIVVAILVLLIGYLTASKIKSLIVRKAIVNSDNALTRTFVSQIVSVFIKLISIVIALRVFGFSDLTSNILAGAGILTFIVGFAFKDIGENFLAGILMAFKSPFKINDLIETEGVIGYVVDLTIRDTRIKTLDGKDVFIPNGQIINNPLFNYTIDGFLRYEFNIGLGYDNNVHDAILLILNTVKRVEGVINDDKKPTVTIDQFAASTINLKVMFWIDTFKSTSKSYHSGIKTEVMERVLQCLTDAGYSLPSDIIEVKQVKD